VLGKGGERREMWASQIVPFAPRFRNETGERRRHAGEKKKRREGKNKGFTGTVLPFFFYNISTLSEWYSRSREEGGEGILEGGEGKKSRAAPASLISFSRPKNKTSFRFDFRFRPRAKKGKRKHRQRAVR